MSDIIIKHGFQTIYLNFKIPNNKGQKLFESKHVINVKSQNGLSRIVGFVIRQTSVMSDPWKVSFDVGFFITYIILQYFNTSISTT